MVAAEAEGGSFSRTTNVCEAVVPPVSRSEKDTGDDARLSEESFGGGQPGAFDRWLEAAKGSEEAEPKGFAQGLIKDYEAVRAALTQEWSNGVDRGQINGLKVLKRQMHGRANVDLLKARFLHAA